MKTNKTYSQNVRELERIIDDRNKRIVDLQKEVTGLLKENERLREGLTHMIGLSYCILEDRVEFKRITIGGETIIQATPK